MKHLLNNLSEEEKNSIREQHEGGMKLDTSRFRTLMESKSGNVKPLVEQDAPSTEDMPLDPIADEELAEMVGVDYSDMYEEDFEDKVYPEGDKPLSKEPNPYLDEYFELGEDYSDYRMYDLPEIHQSIEDEIEGMSDDEAIEFLKETIEFCEDKLNGYDFGFAKHSGDFGGDDSEDEEELDLREFDDLDEDETW